MQVEISAALLNIIRDVAQKQGRSEQDVLAEAMRLYLREQGMDVSVVELSRGPGIGEEVGVTRTETVGEGPPRDPFLALLDRMRSRFELDPDEAMSIAVEEQHAARRERREKAQR